ncbi:MAG: MBL fold metallo-hydrolase [Candidatus Fimimorpha sp.]
MVSGILNFLGCGSAFNPLLGNTSAYFETEDGLFLIDAGESVFTKLYQQELLIRYDKITILITHMHADHVGSLPSIISYCYYVLGKKVAVVYPECSLWNLLSMMGISDQSYDCIEKSEVEMKKIKIKAIPVKHAEDIKCYGYEINNGTEKIFYSGDSYEIPSQILKKFYDRSIDRIYQDTTEFPSEHLSHCPLETLEQHIPSELREHVYCMHFTNDFSRKIRDKGFQSVNVTN